MHKPKNRYTFCYKKSLKEKFINILYIGEMDLQNKIENLDELISKKQKQLAKLISKRQKQKQLAKEDPKKKLSKIVSSTNKAYESFNVDIINNKDPQVQLHQSKELTKDFLIGELNKNYGIKINIRLNITFMKQIEKVNVGFFKSNAREIINENDIETVISDAGNELINRISEWISEGSGWVIKSVDKHEIDISKYKPLRGSSYLPLPEKNKKNKKATINIQNKNDNKCFRWCHLAFLFSVKQNAEHISKYKEHIDKVKYDKINFPVKLKDIPKIENMNDIKFNVFGVDDKESIYPLYISKKKL